MNTIPSVRAGLLTNVGVDDLEALSQNDSTEAEIAVVMQSIGEIDHTMRDNLKRIAELQQVRDAYAQRARDLGELLAFFDENNGDHDNRMDLPEIRRTMQTFFKTHPDIAARYDLTEYNKRCEQLRQRPFAYLTHSFADPTAALFDGILGRHSFEFKDGAVRRTIDGEAPIGGKSGNAISHKQIENAKEAINDQVRKLDATIDAENNRNEQMLQRKQRLLTLIGNISRSAHQGQSGFSQF